MCVLVTVQGPDPSTGPGTEQMLKNIGMKEGRKERSQGWNPGVLTQPKVFSLY